MGGGKLKTRYYKTRRGGRGWIMLLAAALLLAAGAFAWISGVFFRGAPLVNLQPAPTLTPQDSAADTRLLTLAGETWYALQLGAFDAPESARSLAEIYRARGAAGLIWQRDTLRVLAAAYETRSDAQAVQSRLISQHSVETTVTDIAWPEITLRLTGQKAQLDALADAYGAVPRLARHLLDVSAALDRGEQTPAQALNALQSERDTASALARRLQTLFGDGGHPAVQDVRSLLNDVANALDAALNIRDATLLSAQVKYCQLLCLCRMASHAQGLAQ